MSSAQRKPNSGSLARDLIALKAVNDIAQTRAMQEQALELQQKQLRIQALEQEKEDLEKSREQKLRNLETVKQHGLKIHYEHLPIVEDIALSKSLSLEEATQVFRDRLVEKGLSLLLLENESNRDQMISDLANEYQLTEDDVQRKIKFCFRFFDNRSSLLDDLKFLKESTAREKEGSRLANEFAAKQRLAKKEAAKRGWKKLGSLIVSIWGLMLFVAAIAPELSLFPRICFVLAGAFSFSPTFKLISKLIPWKIHPGVRFILCCTLFFIAVPFIPSQS
ncbi:MAG: hypothetical protein P4M08_01370 [Oligoflexia bacterium]|nr:hypothetical protein [Oligoflexia bacterium]